MVEFSRHCPVLMTVTFLIGAVLTPIVSRSRKKFSFWWAFFVSLLGLFFCFCAVWRLYTVGPISYWLGGWEPPYGIEVYFDYISTITLLMTALGVLIIVYSNKYIRHDISEEKLPTYYSLVLLLLGGMVGFSVTGDMFNLYVFLEILSLSGYALVAITGEKLTAMASFKYLVIGAVSSLCVLFGIAFLYNVTGSLNMADIAFRLQQTQPTTTTYVALALFIIGFSVKAAMFPLHIWLPDAHALAPSSVSALLSGLVIKVGIVGILRVLYCVYKLGGSVDFTVVTNFMGWLAAITILVGAFFAFFQDDIKMIFAYSSISNIGYIIMGISLVSFSQPERGYLGMVGGLIHIFNHAIIKSTLFLCAGAIIYKTGFRKLSDLRGVGKKMPITCGALTIAALSIAGIPPTAGFICKWYIVLGAIEFGRLIWAGVLLVGALFVFGYYIKIVNAIFFREPVEPITQVDEAPLSMLIPIVILATGCLIMGVFAYIPLNVIKPAAATMLGLPPTYLP
ncbi:monovalent cation/H+ antiporter subunit D family protein [Candidatus Oleimmundimicrobium sp.]|uniref:complex I subunit 5 family protein n=1 Tax=Candidatus Oleimmundimicrobium sp. TaxID=3060597 RepID=UPI002724F565|nr:monovalent cation/H+ antiporter subunit D family protein [Candidatus Oleimmundimicrobium sp.]MDO8885886.1 monovalent cation/H+ antiporter subunit D family protein [Candidatus Oleimmundimicrobium sp.]